MEAIIANPEGMKVPPPRKSDTLDFDHPKPLLLWLP
jgi:hypothetical protein